MKEEPNPVFLLFYLLRNTKNKAFPRKPFGSFLRIWTIFKVTNEFNTILHLKIREGYKWGQKDLRRDKGEL